MRVATMIIGLVLLVVVSLQSCAAGFSTSKAMQEGSGAGALVCFLFLIGSAFAMGVPMVSVVAFALAALVAFLGGATTPFGDLTVWGFAASILTVTAFLGHREKKKATRPPTVVRQA